MPAVLIYTSDGMANQLERSPIWREGLDRVLVRGATEALTKAAALRPRLFVVESGLPQAELLVRQLRLGEATRTCSILVVADGDTWADEIGLLDAGANAVLHLPPGPEWDVRVQALLDVPTRKEARIDARLSLRGAAARNTIRARVSNVSATGMLVETAAELAVGSVFRFVLELPGFETSSGEVRGSGRVVREARPSGYGSEFVELDAIGKEMLRRYLLMP